MSTLIVCPHCDAVHRRLPLAPSETARCRNCGAALATASRFGLETMLALTVAALIVLAIANIAPIVTMEARGIQTSARLWDIIISSADSGVSLVAGISAACVLLFPLLQLTLYIWVLLRLLRGRLPAAFPSAMAVLRQIRPWSMVEVFLIGAMVSIVKMSKVATVTPEPGLWGFGVLTLLLAAIHSFDARQLWDAAEAGSR